MGRTATISPLGLYNWDNTVFDLMQIPEALDKDTLVQNLLAETAELEVLYPNPVVFKNLVAIWSAKQIDIWNRLYATTQYEYNPIENYDRYETGSDSGTDRTTHSGTDTTTDTTTHSGTDATTDTTTHGGTDRRTENITDGGSETENTTSSVEQGGQDSVTGSDTKGHWIAGYDAPTPTPTADGLFKQTRDQDDATTLTEYGKTEDGTGSKTTTFGKTEAVTETMQHGETISKQGSLTHGETITRNGGVTHGEQVATTNEGEHELHAHGNIGTTTTQDMIRQQRSIELFNVYDIIIEDFKMRFCILVY